MLFITTCEIIACLGGRVTALDQQPTDRLRVLSPIRLLHIDWYGARYQGKYQASAILPDTG